MVKTLKPKNYFSKSSLGVFLIIFAVIGLIILIKSLAAPNPNLPGDLNNDNTVNITDLSILLSDYGTSNSAADINTDGTVNVLDLSILLSNYGKSVSGNSSIQIGDTSVLSSDDWNNAGNIIANQVTLSQTATLQSLSIYISQAAGMVRLGVYDSTGPNSGPGTKLAETGDITTTTGWDTGTVTPVSLNPGSYWIAYLTSDNNQHTRLDGSSGSTAWYNYAYGTMPATYLATATRATGHASLYATLTASSSGGGGGTSGKLTGTFNPGNGFFLVRYGSSWTASPSSGYDRYGVIDVGYGNDVDCANLSNAKCLDYRMGGETDYCSSASNCLDGVPRGDADANGWVLLNSSGQPVLYSNSGTDAAADIGNPNYQKAWADNVIARMNLTGVDGIFEDNLDCQTYFTTTPVKYPTTASYEAAYLSFLSYVTGRLHAAGKYLLGNTVCWGGNANDSAWWSQVGQYVDGMLYETFEQSQNDNTQVIGSDADWIGAVNVLKAGQNAGADAYALSYSSDFSGMVALYTRASFLMAWNGKGGGWGLNGGGADPWNSVVFADIGTPTGLMTQSGVGYWRQYSKGQAIVNPSPTSPVTINGHTLQPKTAYIGP